MSDSTPAPDKGSIVLVWRWAPETTGRSLEEVEEHWIAGGPKAYGHDDLAATIADETVANAIRNGISERHDSISGKKLGAAFPGMTCTIVTMMLDGLCRDHQLRV